jgi:hypothetical protein
MKKIILFIMLLGILSIVPAYADNGFTYYAGEMNPPTIDGNLVDWPTYAVWSTVDQVLSGDPSPTNPADFTGKFKAGFNRAQNKLYIAIEYTDQEVVTYASGWLWNGGDYVEIYTDMQHLHETGGTPVTFQQYGFKPNAEMIVYPLTTETAQGVTLAIETALGKMTYEFAFTTYDDYSTVVHLFYGGQTIGFDISMPDFDTDSFSWISWTPSGGKWNNAGLFGNMELMAIDVSPLTVLFNTVGTTAQFTASGGTPPYTWASSDTTVGTINTSGLFTASGYGSTNITATDAKGFIGIIPATVSIIATNAPLAIQPKDMVIYQTMKFGELFD